MAFGPGKGLPSDYYYGVETYDPATGNVSYQSSQAAGVPLPVQYQGDHPAPPPTVGQATKPDNSVPNPGWVYAVNMPSTYPDFAALKAAGSGLVVDMGDPNAATLIAEANKWGVPVAVQVGAGNPGDMTPEEYAAKVQKAKDMGAGTIVLDIEGAGKGTPGSPGWEWSQQVAATIKNDVSDVDVVVTMEPHQDDYNYGAFNGLGDKPTAFWVQSYQGDMTPTDPKWATASAEAALGPGANVVPILGPTQKPPAGVTGYVSFGIPLTGATAAGVYGSTPPDTSNVPFYPGQTPVAGAGSGETPGPPVYVNPTGPFGTGYPTDTTTTGDETNWASAYFGTLGLPPDVANKVNDIFKKYPDTDQAVQFALAYIRGTPWYAKTFPGISYGIQHGLLSNEQDYRTYVSSIDTMTMRYFGRHVSGDEISGYLYSGLTPDIIGKQYQGKAFAAANGQDVNYFLGAFSDEGIQTVDQLTALGNEQSGLDNPMGQKLQRALQLAMQKYSKLFEGKTPTPSLSLGSSGLNSPSLLGGKASPDVQA